VNKHVTAEECHHPNIRPPEIDQKITDVKESYNGATCEGGILRTQVLKNLHPCHN